MCGRMIPLTYDEAIDAIRSIRLGQVANPFPDWPAVVPRKDAVPQSWVPIAALSPVVPDYLEVQELNWGFPVEWKQGPVFNTRIESMLQGRGMWGDVSQQKRCVVPVVKFYEWHKSETVRSRATGRQIKQAYEFQLVDEPVTWLAGIYEGDHFSVVTTEPNEQVASIHDRMPIVLGRLELPQWLGDDFAPLADRSNVVLRVAAEALPDNLATDNGADQLSLF